MNCLHCGKEVSSNFCSECGQRTGVKRITFREGWNDFWARIYGFDGFFPRTLRDLTLRPGYAAREFIRGNRMKYYGPVGYFFLMITLYLLIIDLLGIDFKKFIEHNPRVGMPTAGKGQQAAVQEIIGFISKNLKWIAFLTVPIDAIAARYVFFRKSGLNFVENTVLPFYLRGHMYWLSIVGVLIYKFTGDLTVNTVLPLFLIFIFGFGYSTLFEHQSKVKLFFKGMGVFLFAQLLTVVLAILIVVILMLVSPQFFEQIRPSNN